MNKKLEKVKVAYNPGTGNILLLLLWKRAI